MIHNNDGNLLLIQLLGKIVEVQFDDGHKQIMSSNDVSKNVREEREREREREG